MVIEAVTGLTANDMARGDASASAHHCKSSRASPTASILPPAPLDCKRCRMGRKCLIVVGQASRRKRSLPTVALHLALGWGERRRFLTSRRYSLLLSSGTWTSLATASHRKPRKSACCAGTAGILSERTTPSRPKRSLTSSNPLVTFPLDAPRGGSRPRKQQLEPHSTLTSCQKPVRRVKTYGERLRPNGRTVAATVRPSPMSAPRKGRASGAMATCW